MLVPLSRSLREFDRLSRHVDALLDGPSQVVDRDRFVWRAPWVDVRNTDTGVSLELELPGVSPTDLSVREEKGELIVEAKRTEAKTGFRRALRLSDELDADKIEARLEHGLLRLTIPRRVGTVRQIKVDAPTA